MSDDRDEIEITPAMIEAGVAALLAAGWAGEQQDSDVATVEKIYRAMWNHRVGAGGSALKKQELANVLPGTKIIVDDDGVAVTGSYLLFPDGSRHELPPGAWGTPEAELMRDGKP